MRHALVTAGSKGLGRKAAEQLLEIGHSVTVTYRRDTEGVRELQEKYSKLSDRLLFIQGDVTKKEDLYNMVDESIAAFGRLDFLINNAGPYIFERKKLADYTDDEWYNMVEGNLSAVFHLFKRAVPHMRKQAFGRVITYGFQGAGHAPGWVNRSAFSASKTGVASLTKTIALEEAENGITANMICPGNIVGEMKEAGIIDARQMTGISNTPIGRSGTGEDIARLVAFLCEEDSDMITGSVIEATGGANVIYRFQ
ncbi:SDR family oxidoreductase [Bacillus lacus]|uniref:SDR family oxidoreductase n=1 Tax=Metabacillus lacus TaxID=1983721 RepID=A0A7X2LWQ4_9BACI|nr:SDR family oxidoreductase [Metabacillus lacus]MRX71735.1 SDR family oxidoreductase [Metabacillus lacus]